MMFIRRFTDKKLSTYIRTSQHIADVCVTTTEEQRRTEWMVTESLADFLDPNDRSKTVEGYPAPQRAVLIARKP